MNKKNVMNVTTAMLLLLFMCFSITGCNDDDNKDVVVPENWATVSADPLTIGYKGGDLSCDYTLASELDASVVYVISHELWASGFIDYDQEKGHNVLKIKVEESEIIEEREAKFTLCYDDNHQIEISITQAAAPPTLVSEIITGNIPATIRMNETLNLNEYTSVLPTNASYKTLRFTVAEGSEDKITISEEGILSCQAGGEATINIATTDGGNVTATATILIENDILFDRKGWTATTSITYTFPDGSTLNYAGDNVGGVETGKPEDMFDGKTTTYLALVKTDKARSWKCTAGENNGKTFTSNAGDPMFFVVDMKEEKTFNYFYYGHRTGGGSAYLYAQKVKVYGSNDNTNFTQIGSEIELAQNAMPQVYPLSEVVTYRYVKVEYTLYNTASGNTLQTGEFNLGMNYSLP